MEFTRTNHPDEPLTTLVVMANGKQVALVGEPGWLKAQPDRLSWEAPGRGIYIKDQSGALLGIAATDAEVDLVGTTVVHLVVFDGVEFTEPFSPVVIQTV
jgi:hypothetical protein